MELTKIQAIDKTIEMWEELAESGNWRKPAAPEGVYLRHGCYLCEYGWQTSGKGTLEQRCQCCPWYQYMGNCELEDDSPYRRWHNCDSTSWRRTHATLCLDILYAIRELEADDPQNPVP